MSHKNDPIPLKIRDRDEIRDGWLYHENGGLSIVVDTLCCGTLQVKVPAHSLREWAREDAARTAARKTRRTR